MKTKEKNIDLYWSGPLEIGLDVGPDRYSFVN